MSRTTQLIAWVAALLLCLSGQIAYTDDGAPDFLIDHIGCVVDDATFTSISSSEFLRDSFAHSRPGGARTGAGESWTNFSIFGELTFIEFLGIGMAQELGVAYGDCFVALHSTEQQGAEWLAKQMNELYPESKPRLQLREFARGEERVPWSYNLVFDYASGYSKFDIWVKEYHPEFKARMTGGRAEVGDIDRRRGAASVAYHPNKIFRDVTRLSISVSSERRAQIEQLFEVIGFDRGIENGTSVWRSKDAVFEIVTNEFGQEFALTSIGLALTRALPAAESVRFEPLLELQLGENKQGRLNILVPAPSEE